MLPEQHIKFLCVKFRIRQIVGVIVACAMKDPYFGNALLLMSDYMCLISEQFGGIPPTSILFLVDMMRVGMMEVYGCRLDADEMLQSYRRLCGRAHLRHLHERDRELLQPVLGFFCQCMLCVRGSVRFEKGFATYLCKRAMAAPLVQTVMKSAGLEGLKRVTHFTGLSLHDLVTVSDGRALFARAEDIAQVDALQVERALGMWDRNDVDMPRADVWGRDGPDMMAHALAMYATLAMYGKGATQCAMWDTDFSQVMY